MNKLAISIIAVSLLFACQPKVEDSETSKETTKTDTVVLEEKAIEEKQSDEAIAKMVSEIDAKRENIESSIGEAIELKSDSLRAKVKQKWSKIDFYTNEISELVRIKTYPYAEISKRTEEFYLENGDLILAVIEDDGEGERGKMNESIDKMYYFHNGEMIKEISAKNENEYNIKNLDAEELQAEVKEYIDLYNATVK